MNVGIHQITPDEDLNRHLWRWTLGKVTDREIRQRIYVLVFTRRLHPNTDAELIFKVTRDAYAN